MPGTGGDGLASVTEALTALTATARGGGLDDTAALTALAAARRLAAEFERQRAGPHRGGPGRQARPGPGSPPRWAQATGRPPRSATPTSPAAARVHHQWTHRRQRLNPAHPRPAPVPRTIPGPTGSRETKSAAEVSPGPRGPQAGAHPRASGHRRPQRPAVPRITGAVIAEGRYELVRAPDHAETRAWHVLVGGRRAGLVRPTWRGERSRPGWEAVGDAAPALPTAGIRQDHHRRQRPHPRCRRRQSSARTATAAGKRTQNRHALNRVHQWWTLARQEKLSRPVDQDL